MLERSMVAFALLGAEWVLYLLLFLSIASIAVMLERWMFYRRTALDTADLQQQLRGFLEQRQFEAAVAFLRGKPGMESAVLAEGIGARGASRETTDGVMDSELIRQRTSFERRLVFLGTLGNNAPFLGLLGTVLGIIKAFKDLSLADPSKAQASSQVVMAGISEALVATAVGLAVALPAVVAFNYFKSVVKGRVANTEALRRLIHAGEGPAPGSA